MLNAYIDPNSYIHLDNILFGKDNKYNFNNYLSGHIFLKEYCYKKGINLNTIDLWNPAAATNEDIYVSFDHRCLFRKIYRKLKNKN